MTTYSNCLLAIKGALSSVLTAYDFKESYGTNIDLILASITKSNLQIIVSYTGYRINEYSEHGEIIGITDYVTVFMLSDTGNIIADCKTLRNKINGFAFIEDGKTKITTDTGCQVIKDYDGEVAIITIESSTGN